MPAFHRSVARPISRATALALLCLAPTLSWAETPASPRLAFEARMADPAATPSDRMEAVCALAEVADGDSVLPVMALLEQDLVDRHGFWACAIPLLGQLNDRRAAPLLRQIGDLKQDHLAGMDHMAIDALAAMAMPEDAVWLANKAHILPVRDSVFHALARVGDKRVIDVLVSGLSDGETAKTVAAATAGLIRIGAPVLAAFEQAQTHPDPVLQERMEDIAAAIRQAQ